MSRTLRVLHVEDSERDVALLTRHLLRAGYELISDRVETPAAMRAALETKEWAVILCDYSMPHFNALHALALLKEMGMDIPFIVISGTVGESVAVEAMRAGAHDYLMKDNLVRLAPTIEREMLEAENRRARRRVEAALRESEDRYRDLVEHSHGLICTYDLEGRVLSVNQEAARLLGYDREALLGQNIRDALLAEFRDEFDDYIAKLLSEGTARGLMTVQTSSGEKRVWEYTNTVRTEGVSVPIVRGVAHDVTEQKQAEEALKASEAELRALFAAMTDLIFVLDSEGRYLRIAPTDLTHLYEPLAELMGKTLHEVFPKEKADFFLEQVRTALDKGRIHRVEYTLQISGKEMWFEGSVSPMTKDSVVWIARDNTERKQAEQEQARLNAQIESQRQRLDNIVTTVPGLVWEAWGQPDAATQRIDFISDYVQTLLGYSVEEWLETPNFWLSIIHPDDREEAARATAASFESGKSISTVEFRWVAKDGRVIWVESNYAVIMDDEGWPAGLRGVTTDISERKRAEEALRESEERYRVVAETATDIIVTIDENGTILFINEAVERVFGFSVSELLGKQITVLMPAYLRHVHEAAVSMYVQTGRKHIIRESIELLGLHKSGQEISLELSFGRFSKDGKRFFTGIARDISERRLAGEQLRHQLDFTEAITTSLGEGVYALDKSGRVTFMNPAAEVALGWKQEELLGQEMHEVIHIQDADGTRRPANECPLLGVLNSGKAVEVEGDVFTHRDGTMFPVSYTSSPIISEGQVVGAVLAFRDITERNKAEAALRKAEEKYRSIFENAVEGIFQSIPDGRFISVNPAMARILGCESPEELIADHTDIGKQNYVDPNCRAELERMLVERGTVAGFECEIFRKDLTRIWVVENIRAIRDESGAVLYYEGSVEDITERKMLEEQLRQAQKMEAIGQLAGGIAHDFNNLLTAITGYSELTMRRLHAQDPLRPNLEEIKKAGRRAAALTRQLLAFSHKQVLQPKVLDLNLVVSELEKMLRRLIGEDIELRTVLGSALGNTKADPGQIEQVIMNLAVNARDAMPKGGKLTIETGNVYLNDEYARQHIAVNPGAFVMLAVSDTGNGMDPKTQSRIFEPFFTTKEVGKGTGLGLSTVYGIVKQSGGSIWVYSEVGRGTTFKIYLPRIDEGAEEYRRSTEVEEVFQGTEMILIAEDEEVVRNLACQVLEMYGYQVMEAANGGAALLICERYTEPIHLLITDVIMPEMSGIELANRLNHLRTEMKVLYMSGYTDNAIVNQGPLDEAANFIQKPFSPDDLARKVRELLDIPGET